MIAAFVKTKYKVELRELPAPKPGKGQVVVRVDACGVCGSDFIAAGYWAKQWQQFGHEVVGTIHETGQGVSGFKAGDRVVLALSVPCGQCAACRKKLPRYCSQLLTALQGGFSDYLLVHDTRLLRPIASTVPSQVAFMAEPLTVIYEAFQLAGLGNNDSLFVAGGGFLGALGALTAHLLGIPVAGVLCRRLDQNLKSVQKLTGFVHFNWPKAAVIGMKPWSKLQSTLSGHVGRTVVLHTAPAKTIPYYLDALPYAATVVNIGLSGRTRENQLQLDASKTIFRRTQILSAFPVPCLYLDDVVSLLERYQNKFCVLKPLVISLEELPRIFLNRSRAAKIVVSMEDATLKSPPPYL